jgi:tetratricopeptide (TPR) repeat protein
MATMKKCFFLLFFLTMAVLWADVWHVHYRDAKAASRKGNWLVVIGHIEKALQDSPQPKYQKKTYGLDFENYFPYYLMGLAHFRLEDYEKAQAALNKSLEFGEVLKDAALAGEVGRMLKECRRLQTQNPELEPAIRESQENSPDQALDKAATESGDFPDALLKQSPPLTQPTPQSSQVRDDTRQKIVDTWMAEAQLLRQQRLFKPAMEKYRAILQLEPRQPQARSGLELVGMLVVREHYRTLLRYFFSGETAAFAEGWREGIAYAEGMGQKARPLMGEMTKLMILSRIRQSLYENWSLKRESEVLDELMSRLLSLRVDPELSPGYFWSPKLVSRYGEHLARCLGKSERR